MPGARHFVKKHGTVLRRKTRQSAPHPLHSRPAALPPGNLRSDSISTRKRLRLRRAPVHPRPTCWLDRRGDFRHGATSSERAAPTCHRPTAALSASVPPAVARGVTVLPPHLDPPLRQNSFTLLSGRSSVVVGVFRHRDRTAHCRPLIVRWPSADENYRVEAVGSNGRGIERFPPEAVRGAATVPEKHMLPHAPSSLPALEYPRRRHRSLCRTAQRHLRKKPQTTAAEEMRST
mmetsp:Transcript_15443/g.47789  ORF Transcript_15443/g.47789 Transcript_15443/m.47789 type:complete len:233 (+) Transcript_15443:884-1582(+)